VKLACPKCSANASTFSGLMGQQSAASCATCGWNLAVAIRRCKDDLMISAGLAALGIIVAAVVLVRGRYGFGGAALLGFVFIALPGGFALVALTRQSRLRKLQERIGESGGPPPSVANREAAALRDAPLRFAIRSRQVRLSLRGWFYSAGVTAITFFWLWLLSFMLNTLKEGFGGHFWRLFFLIATSAFSVGQCSLFFRNRIREWGLFRDGEVSCGKVFARGRNSYGHFSISQIVYEFRDGGQRLFQKRETDFPEQMYEEMAVHVFYDRDDPRRSVALESSLYRVK
jgi:hypothetical protein